MSDKIFIFSLFVGCFYHKGPALKYRVNVTVHAALRSCNYMYGMMCAESTPNEVVEERRIRISSIYILNF